MENQRKIDIEKSIFDYNVITVLTSLHGVCRGCCRKRNDGYLILIENTLSEDRMLQTVLHELLHIVLGHLDDDVKTEEEKELEVETILTGLSRWK